MVPDICKFMEFETIYTNHCLRVSCCTILGENFTENEVKSVSGHKSNSSLGIYKRIKLQKKADMSSAISSTLGVTEVTAVQSSNYVNAEMPVLEPQLYDEEGDIHTKVIKTGSDRKVLVINNPVNCTLNF